MSRVRLALAQINPTVGDLVGNEQKIRANIARATELQADIVAFPELAIPGYPPEDLLLKPGFVAANRACLDRIAEATTGVTAIVGFADWAGDLYNAAAILHAGQVAGIYHKVFLPTYGVFDEDRYFCAGGRPLLFSLGDVTVGVNICEDIWSPGGPTTVQTLAGAQLVINISSSPYHSGKAASRERMLATRAADNVVYVAFCNLVGGQDELVFDGGSVVFDGRGDLVARADQFEEELLLVDLDLAVIIRQQLRAPRRRKARARQAAEAVERIVLAPSVRGQEPPSVPARIASRYQHAEEVYRALVLGTRDYVRKNDFHEAVVGLSGGIDSALTAAIAADALGSGNIVGVFMPSRYSSIESREDAAQLASNLGIRFLTFPIDAIFQAYLDLLSEPFTGRESDVTEENIQARIRGNILMALSNKFGWLVLATGNKSEVGVGYATLYGDMAGGFSAIKDVPKTLVYQLAERVNARLTHPAIPQRIFDKAPTAELRPDQKDEDSLPPYHVLDPILHAYVEEDCGLGEIIALGFDADTVSDVLRMVDRAEYKRRQAPPGVRITPRAFGKDRRLPITNRYRDA
jgi:NAD+ synthase (glutamine-hydrolysing)